MGAVPDPSPPAWPLETTFALHSIGGQTLNFERAVPGLNRDEAHACDLPVPDVSQHRARAPILGRLDAKIELNRRMNETLEALARALFKSWFVDCDPVRVKMAGRETGLPWYIDDLFPDRLVDSELGEIPEGWEASLFCDVIDLNPKRTL